MLFNFDSDYYNIILDQLPFLLYHEQTPLHLAAAKGFAQCIRLLIEYGACTDIEDFNSQRPVDLARGKKRCEKVFEDAKAQNLIPLPTRSEKEQRTAQGKP